MTASPNRPFGFQPVTVGWGVRSAATRDPGKIAVIDGSRALTYGALIERMDRLVDRARAAGLRPGDHAAIVSRNRLEYIEVCCGLPDAGVAVATVNARLTTAEIVAICDDACARLLIVEPAHAASLRAQRFATLERIIEIGPEYEAWLADADPTAAAPAAVEEWDVWTIPYTSGTTGRPKGVLVSHRSRVFSFAGMASNYRCYGPDDKFLAMAPLNHGGGLAFAVASIFYGGTMEILDRFDPEITLRKLKQDGFTGVFMVPTHFQMIFEMAPAVLDAYRRPGLRALISNAAPLPQAMKEKIVPYFGETVLHECYGSTEGSIITSLPPTDQLRKDRCVGLPFANTRVRLLNEAGEDCAPGEVGELHSQSPFHFNGYWRRPEETEAAFSDGWLHVGDLARRDDEGFIYIVDRKKDMVISGGVNIYPREIEEVLIRHPELADVAVVGAPDERWGETLVLFAVPREGAAPTQGSVAEFCRDRLAAFKIPGTLILIDQIPRNAGGKIVKTDLKAAAIAASEQRRQSATPAS
jgi:acyl-CoA synthetase (AMP-forming)/AMP-acid ligase II